MNENEVIVDFPLKGAGPLVIKAVMVPAAIAAPIPHEASRGALSRISNRDLLASRRPIPFGSPLPPKRAFMFMRSRPPKSRIVAS